MKNNHITNFDSQIEYMMRVTRQHELMSAEQLGLKVFEEGGEFGAAINIHVGMMPHKTIKETPFHEAADVINSLCGALVQLYPELTVEQIKKQLNDALKEKGDKYVSIITE